MSLPTKPTEPHPTAHPAAPPVQADQLALVRHSFAELQPVAPQLAAMFYDRLLERAPATAALFAGDLAQQGQRWMVMLTALLARLENTPGLQALLHPLRQAQHDSCGAPATHCSAIGGALIDTLGAGLGPAFTPAHRTAWTAVVRHLSHCTASPCT